MDFLDGKRKAETGRPSREGRDGLCKDKTVWGYIGCLDSRKQFNPPDTR